MRLMRTEYIGGISNYALLIGGKRDEQLKYEYDTATATTVPWSVQKNINADNKTGITIKITDITSVKFVSEITPATTKDWFKGYTGLKTIEGINNLKVKNMSNLFAGCSRLTTFDVSGLDKSNVTNMTSMFKGCSGLKTFTGSQWDTSNLTDMTSMFYGCSELTTLDVSQWDTSKVTNMNPMFYKCSKLTSSDVSGLDKSSVSDVFKEDDATFKEYIGFGGDQITGTYYYYYDASSTKLVIGAIPVSAERQNIKIMLGMTAK